ncbi:hypothetical protein EMEDMD4_240099 [Sinorhizobium medicae]|uniref:Uncharacterized protein n=1 Tax=Sinorhizobium medicae TaxID=110321 RepID=A0A508WUS7_9HYPH|nr:hypothetical protein EMEDMD4_240099 [Sinorhizobium medicae]
MLEILLTEIGAVRLDDVEELCHDSGNACEMAGPDCAFEFGAKLRQVDHRFHRPRIHVGNAGGKQDVDPAIRQQLLIAGKVTRIFAEILVCAELKRIDENARHHHVVLAAGAANELHVSDMKITHRGDQTDGPARPPVFGKGVTQFCNGGDSSHFRILQSAGARKTARHADMAPA